MSQEQPAGQKTIPSVAVENDFSDLKQCDLDRRQTKILKEILWSKTTSLDARIGVLGRKTNVFLNVVKDGNQGH